MSGRVFVHVGAPKTGTTFLQEVLWSQRELARAQGLLLPMGGFYDHYLANLDLRGLSARKQHPTRAVGMWDRLSAEAREWPGDVLVSHELFGAATAEQAQRAVASFGDAEVHVVMTARDLVRQIPAEWQEHIKHRSSKGFGEFVDELRHGGRSSRWFWRVQDVPVVLQRWGQTLPRNQLHVVVVPPAGSDPARLWELFTSLLGLDGTAFALDRSRPNTSLRAEQVELLRQVNAQLGRRLPIPGPYPAIVKDVFAHEVLANRPGTAYGLSDAALDFALARSKEMAQALGDMEIDVVGDLADLMPGEGASAPVPAQLIDPEQVGPEALVTEGNAALADLLTRLHRERVAARKQAEELAEVRAERDFLVEQWTRRPVRHMLKGLGQRRPWLMRLIDLYRRRLGTLPGDRGK